MRPRKRCPKPRRKMRIPNILSDEADQQALRAAMLMRQSNDLALLMILAELA